MVQFPKFWFINPSTNICPSYGNIHSIKMVINIKLTGEVVYYLPGEAVVYGTMNNNKNEEDGNGILIFGHGTLSGDRLPHPNYADDVPDNEHWRYHGINIDGKTIGVWRVPCS